MTCNARLEVVLSGSTTARSMRCTLYKHEPNEWHQSPQGSMWKTRDADKFCQVTVGEDGDIFAYTCLQPLPCAEHAEEQT